jgi:hypothetical protein
MTTKASFIEDRTTYKLEGAPNLKSRGNIEMEFQSEEAIVYRIGNSAPMVRVQGRIVRKNGEISNVSRGVGFRIYDWDHTQDDLPEIPDWLTMALSQAGWSG